MPGDPFRYADEVFAFRESLSGETDRGCALMAAAYLADQLERLLRRSFVDEESVVDDLFGPLGPLGSFSVRIELCYAFGLLPKQARKDLHLIRKIRNEFAHNANTLTFRNPQIAARCGELYHNVRGTEAPPRGKFTSSVMALCAEVHHSIYEAARRNVPPGIEMTAEEKRKIWEFANNTAEEIVRHLPQTKDASSEESDS